MVFFSATSLMTTLNHDSLSLSMKTTLRILHLEDDRRDAKLVRDTLAANNIVADVQRVDCECDFVAQLEQNDFDLILADYKLPSFSGISALTIAREKRPDKPFIFVSGTLAEEAEIETLKGGATDYVLKHRLQKLPFSVWRAMTEVDEHSERRLADEAQSASELRYRRLFESAKDGILILDADSGQIIDVNPYLIEMLAFSKEEFVGKELWEIGPFKDIVASKLAFAELQRRGYIRYENLPLQTREGIVRQVEFVSNSYLAGESRVIQCNIRDITDRKLAEEQAFADLQNKTNELASMTQQLWQASKLATMGELAASVAHELNNPLATISLHAEVLVGELAADDSSRRSLLVIEQEVERMATLVSNLLLFSRRSHRQVTTVDLREELTTLLEFVRYHLRSHKIDIVQDFAAALPAVEADRQQLRQVFLNLISNASDAMPQGGTLTVTGRPEAMDGGQTAAVVEFTDTGIGVQPSDLPKLWEPFFTTKPEGKGIGLGLAICRRTVEQHHGTIEIETKAGQGATVRITLPAIDEGIEVAA
jgi:PAS domain S-box-containing protein